MSADVIIYMPVSDSAARKLILKKIGASPVEINIQLSSKIKLKLMTIDNSNSDFADGLAAKGDFTELREDQNSRISFEFENLSYYFYGPIQIVGETAYFHLQGELFKEQRRSNFRFQIPDFYSANFTFSQVGEELISKEVRMIDFTEVGLRMKIPYSFSLEVDQAVQGTIQMGNHPILKVSGIIRSKAKSDGGFTVGLEFNSHFSENQSALHELVAALRSDVFFLSQQE